MAVMGLGEIAEELGRATVLIHSENRGEGSGIIWSSDGSIVTNAHVVRGSRASIQLWDNREFEATILSRDSRRDLAALCIAASGLRAVSVADSSQIRPGELVIAIGNPLGFVGALSTGVIHAVGTLRGIGSQQWVQAGVRLAPDAWLGVKVHPVRVPRGACRGSAFGLVLLKVEQGSPAASASLLPGDVLLGTDEKSFFSANDLAEALQGRGPRLVRFEFLRGDYQSIRRVTARFGEQLASGSGVAA
jgi:serine protease Do